MRIGHLPDLPEAHTAPQLSAPVVLGKLLELNPVRYEGSKYNLEQLLSSRMSAAKIATLLWLHLELDVSPTTINRWRNQ